MINVKEITNEYGETLKDFILRLIREELEKEECLRKELDLERMRLAACGVVALSNTRSSAEVSRSMHPDYLSASCRDVMSAVDREMKMRESIQAALKELGVPTEQYPAPVANAVRLLEWAIK